ncbi:MAG: hypothetical protein R2724_07800 [Bryobacterales bacterium]
MAVAGNPASTTILTETVTEPIVEIGGVQADILFSGLTPGTSVSIKSTPV